MEWSVTTPATGTVVSWEILKSSIHPATSTEQTFIMQLEAEATAYAETMMEACLLPQTITAIYTSHDIDHWGQWWEGINLYEGIHGKPILLPRGPILSITSVTDANSNAVPFTRQTYGNAEYLIPSTIIYPSGCPITVVYQAGFTTIDPDIVGAIRVHAGQKYMYRESTSVMPANDVAKLDAFYQRKGRNSQVH